MTTRPPWNDPRIALLYAEYSTDTNTPAFLVKLNAIPCEKQIMSVRALQEAAISRGIRKTKQALAIIKSRTTTKTNRAKFSAPEATPSWGHRVHIAAPPPPPDDMTLEQQAALVDAQLDDRLAHAREIIFRKMSGKSVAAAMKAFDDACQDITKATRLPQKVVRRLAGEVRMGL